MRAIKPRPTSWVTVAERGVGVDADFRACGLVDPEHVTEELARDRSRVSEVGEVELFEDCFHDGMTDSRDGHVEFFCQIRVDDLEDPVVDWSPPFLWYWRAFRRDDFWIYRDAAGRDVQLARFFATVGGSHRVEVEAMALRHYLDRRRRNLLIGFDLNSNHLEEASVEREEYETSEAWISAGLVVFDWETLDEGVRAAVWLHGQYVVLPAAGAVGPSWCGRDEIETGAGIEFVYGVDEETGAPLTVTPTVANTGTDGGLGPHAFTRIFFRPQVLERYTSEPRRYTVTASRIECLHVWGLSIGRTSDGLIEVDLYDLRTKARSELLHWQAHNVPPSGARPDEGKCRRERLNTPAVSPDPVRDLRTALTRANAAAAHRLGSPLWGEMSGPGRVEWDALHPPVGDDRTALQQPLLALTKALCDQLDRKLIVEKLNEQPPSGTGSLVSLKQYLTQIGADPDYLSPFFELQNARSKGGFAHYAGRGADSVVNALAPGLTRPAEIFTTLCSRLTASLNYFAESLDADR